MRLGRVRDNKIIIDTFVSKTGTLYANFRNKAGIVIIFSFLMSLLCTSCANQPALTAPELIEPEGMTYDSAIAYRGDVALQQQYKGLVKLYTKELFFTNTDFPILEINAIHGQQVKKGDILAKLDARDMDKWIEEQEEYIRYLEIKNNHENDILKLDIEIAELEQNDHAEVLQQQYRQNLEIQDLSMLHERKKLADLYAKTSETMIVAPFDGTILYVDNEVKKGSWITPFKPIFYLSEGEKIFVENISVEHFSVYEGDVVTGQIGSTMYELEYLPLTKEETLAFMLNGKNPVMRFEIVDAGDEVKAGDFVSILLETGRDADTIVIPSNALYSSSELGQYVYVMEQGKKVLRPIKVGLKNSSSVSVKEGVAEGEEIFVKQ